MLHVHFLIEESTGMEYGLMAKYTQSTCVGGLFLICLGEWRAKEKASLLKVS